MNTPQRRKTPARSRVKYGWRENRRRHMAFVIKGRLMAEQAERDGVITPEVAS